MKDFYPEDTDTTMYILGGFSETPLNILIEVVKEKWGDNVNLGDISIEPEYIQTRSIGYDLYDASDYDNYLVITYKENK